MGATRAAIGLCVCALLVSCGIGPSFNASVRVSGQVTDEAGQPLDDVRVHVRESRFTFFTESFSSSETSDMALRDGRFEFACRRCTGLQVDFSRDGYYPESRDFNVEKVEPDADGRVQGPDVRPIEREDLRIVLRSRANEAQLVPYEARLQSTADGPVTVAPFRRDLGSAGVTPDRLGEPPSKEASWLPGHVRLLPGLDEAGGLAERPLPDRPGYRNRVPAAAVLDFSPALGGVVLHGQEEGNPRPVYRAMRTAPEGGYKTTLRLPTDGPDGYYFFYFRTGDRYGKGFVTVPSFDHARDGREVVSSYIELRLNPDGSRNVETAR